MLRQLLDIEHHAIEPPLPIHLGFAAQRKAVQSFVATQVSNTGSTVAKRRVIISLPFSESIFTFIRSAGVFVLSRFPWKKEACRVCIFSGVHKHSASRLHGTQSCLAPLNFITAWPLMVQFDLLP